MLLLLLLLFQSVRDFVPNLQTGCPPGSPIPEIPLGKNTEWCFIPSKELAVSYNNLPIVSHNDKFQGTEELKYYPAGPLTLASPDLMAQAKRAPMNRRDLLPTKTLGMHHMGLIDQQFTLEFN